MSEWIEWKGALNGPVPAAQPGTRYEGQCRNGAIVPDMFTADPVCQVVYWTKDRQSERDVVAFRIVSAVEAPWIAWNGDTDIPRASTPAGHICAVRLRDGSTFPDDRPRPRWSWPSSSTFDWDVVAYRHFPEVEVEVSPGLETARALRVAAGLGFDQLARDLKKLSPPGVPDPFKKYRDAASGGSTNYYVLQVDHPTSPDLEPYTCECQDVIEALGMTFSEGEVFKALWRSCAARTLGLRKEGADEHGVRDAEKIVHFGQLILASRGRK